MVIYHTDESEVSQFVISEPDTMSDNNHWIISNEAKILQCTIKPTYNKLQGMNDFASL